MLIVELEEFIFQIDFIAKNNFLQNLNFSYLSKNNNDSNIYSLYLCQQSLKVYDHCVNLFQYLTIKYLFILKF